MPLASNKSGPLNSQAPRHKGSSWRIIRLVLMFIMFWCAGFIYFSWYVIPQNLYKDNPQAQQQSDIQAVIVLTGGSLRIDAGLEALNKHEKVRLFISGVHHGTDVSRLLMLFNQGDKQLMNRIELGHEADDTPGNALEVARWTKQNDIKNAILITASYHMPRALMELHYRAPHLNIITEPVFPKEVKIKEWYLYQGTARLLFSEYNKYIITWAKIASFKAQDWLLSNEAL